MLGVDNMVNADAGRILDIYGVGVGVGKPIPLVKVPVCAVALLRRLNDAETQSRS